MDMKTIFRTGLIALAVLGLSSCAKEITVDQVNPDTPIEFGTYLGRAAQTKAGVAKLEDGTYGLQKTGFGVYAYYTGQNSMGASATPNYMSNQLVEWKSSKWEYSPVKYWPNNTNDKVSFYAYAPYEDGADPNTTNISVPDNTATGEPAIGFTVNETVVDQTDLLYATALKDQTKPLKYTEKTTFTFNHALSRVAFSVQLMADAVNGDTTGSTDDDTTVSGTINDTETTIAVTQVDLIGKFYNSGTLQLNGGTWTVLNAAESTDYTLASANFNNDVASKVTITDTALNKDDSYIMIIPKEFKESDMIKIRVTYTVTTTDTNLNEGKSEITNVIESTPFTFNFEQGKAYNFSLHLGLDSVQFEASVAPWADGTQADTAVNVPINAQ